MTTYTPTYRQPKLVSISASGDNIVIPGLTGYAIQVHGWKLTAATPVTLEVKDGAGNSAGVEQAVVTSVIGEAEGRSIVLQGAPDAGITINLSGAVLVTGTIWFSQYQVAPL